ncbi:MAG: LLM class flavin-dependent oxidoreductase, partial [Halobacteriota archaeon]|nr:LLM class flavin-dependent oxidoreductase [Halobacteriota archaeon]
MPAVKFGLMIPTPTQPIDEVFKHTRLAEKNGFDSIWIADHLVMMRPGFVPDAWSVLSAISMITKDMMLGTCVSDPHRRHPAVFAQILATIDRISNGRVALGMGPGESMNVEAFGIDFERPVTKMTESVEIIRRLLHEKKVTYNGDFFELKDAFLQVKPVGKVPFYIGSNSPKTRRLTGMIGDGWMPFLETPDTYRDHLKDVHVGTEEANRD